MSLNNIELPDFVLTELYRNSLIAADMPATAADKKSIAADTPAKTADTKAITANTPITGKKDIPGAAAAQTEASSNKVASSHTGSSSPTIASSSTIASSKYKTLGNNRKNITIVVQSPGTAFLPDEHLAFLTRMLEACSLNIGDVAIVNHAAYPVGIDALKQQLKPSVVLLFGVEPAAIKLPVDFPQFKIQDYDQRTYLYSSSLAELAIPGDESKPIRGKLWLCLKTIFGV